MKRNLLISLGLAFAGFAGAQTFTNDVISTSFTGGFSKTITSVGNMHCVTFGDLFLQNGYAGLDWDFDFTAGSTPFTDVLFTIQGEVIGGGQAGVLGTEIVWDTSVDPATQAGTGVIADANIPAGKFTLFALIPLNPGLKMGHVQKDITFGSNADAKIRIDKVCQTFNSVPEPSSIAALVAGTALVALRRRRK